MMSENEGGIPPLRSNGEVDGAPSDPKKITLPRRGPEVALPDDDDDGGGSSGSAPLLLDGWSAPAGER